MARTLIVSDRHNSFFSANNIRVGNQIPTEGNYVKGDIIVNTGNLSSDAMWICVESGNPGLWEVVGAGSGTTGGGSTVVSISDTVFVNEPVREVSLEGLDVIITSSDKLTVHHNSVHLMEGIDYKIEGNKIVKLTEGYWNEDSEEAMFAFELLKNVEQVDGSLVEVKTKLVCMQNTVTVQGAVREVLIGIQGFNKDYDTLMVFENETFLTRGVNYEINEAGNGIVPVGGEVWNDIMIDDWSYTFVVFKDVPLVEGETKIGMGQLAEDVKEAIENASNIDLSGYATKEEMGEKVAQTEYDAKIAELEGRVNEAFTNANNGKQLIASAIGEPVSSEDTFSAMSNDINGLLSTFKTNMMNNGVTVNSGDKFKALIDKIATMVEEGSGKGIQFATGTINNFSFSKNYQTLTFDANIGFIPTYFFIHFGYVKDQYSGGTLYNFAMSNIKTANISDVSQVSNTKLTITDITESSFSILGSQGASNESMYSPNFNYITWYAIGVGEEDTTLRDSLASILTDEGVTVTEEDNMASLIGKVDEEFTKDNNTINDLNTDKTNLTNQVNNLNKDKTNLTNQVNSLNSNIENTRNTLAGLMQEGGYNINGNESINSLLNLLVLSGISVSDIKQIAGGHEHTLILKHDGSLYSCGAYGYGGLGLNGDNSNRTEFEQVTTNINNDVKQIACGEYHTFILKNDGSVWSCGNNKDGQLGLGTSDSNAHKTFTKVTTNINNDVKQIACGYSHTFILKNDGSLWACGKNDKGQLGLGNTTTKKSFTQVTTNINKDVKQVVCGYNHTVILKNDGSVWSCGYNKDGQLGLGTNDTNAHNTFTKVTTNINKDVKQVVCGGYYTCILKNDGSLWVCGANDEGQLGLNDDTNRTTFTKVTTNINKDVKQIACGFYHTFILKNNGSVWCCGNNDSDQLGLNSTSTYITTFTQVTENINNDVRQIACGYYHTFILKTNSSTWSCGDNIHGQLGLGNTTDRYIFTIIPRGI